MIKRPNYQASLKALIDPTLIIVVIVLLIIGIIVTMLFTNKVKEFRDKYKTNYYIYLLSSMLIFAFVIFLGQSKLINDLFNEFVFYQVIIFGLGTLHTILYRTFFKSFDKKGEVWPEIIFALMIMIFSAIPFMLVFCYISGITYTLYFTSAIIPFIVPTLINLTFNKSISIPAKVFITWPFPAQGTHAEPNDEEMRELLVITLMFYKSTTDEFRTEFRAKTPLRMDFGRVFYHFANDYNLRNPDDPLILTDEKGSPQNWTFYIKPKWYGVSKYIDPKYPLWTNGVEENCVVFCQRSDPQKLDDWKEKQEELKEEQKEKQKEKEEQKEEAAANNN